MLRIWKHSPRLLAALSLLTLSSCTESTGTLDPESAQQFNAAAVVTDSRDLRDVRAVTIELPPMPRPWDTNDGALVDVLRAEEGHAIVAFKSPDSNRASNAAGHRAALPASTFESGLALLERHGAEILYVYQSFGAAGVRIDPALAPELRADPLVDYIEPRHHYRLAGSPATRVGTGTFASTAASQVVPWGISMVRAPEAWAVSTGGGVDIMIVDTGVNPHADLPGIPSSNCAGPYGGCTDGGVFHGTHVAGIAFAQDNTIGVVGVAPGLSSPSVYSWAACNPTTRNCESLSVAGAIDAAKMAGIKIINMSFGGITFDLAVANAAASADSAGVLLVSIAGNVPDATEGFPVYPGALASVIAVSGVRPDRTFASSSPCPSRSNFGSHVDISAPYWALSTVGTSAYADETGGFCGTSMAAPHVAGAAAIVWAANPSWTNTQVRDQLFATANHPTGGSRDDYFGHGIVDVAAAVGIALPPPPDPPVVYISGPSEILPGATCTWDAIVVAGDAPFTYWWSGQAQPWGGSDSWYTGKKDSGVTGNSFKIRVDVSNGGGSDWDEITVTEVHDAPECLI